MQTRDDSATMDQAQFARFIDTMAGMRIRTRRPETFSSGDGPEWLVWRENYITMVGLNGWGDAAHLDRSKNEALASIAGHAKRLVAGIQSAGANETLNQFLDRLQARYLPAAGARLAKTEFEGVSQLPGEQIISWHGRLRVLFVRAFPDQQANADNAEQLIRRFILGLSSTVIKTYVLDHNPQTYAAALDHANDKAATEAAVAGQQVAGGKISAMDPMDPDASLNFVYDGTSTPSTAQANQRLRKMGPAGAPSSSAPSSAPLCWNCGKAGHYQRDCRQNPAVSAVRRGRGRGRGARGGRGQPGKGRGSRSGGSGRGAKRSVNNIDDPAGPECQYTDPITELAREINNAYDSDESGN